MADILNRIDQLRLAKTTENLKKNNFQVVFVEKKEEVLSAFARLVPKAVPYVLAILFPYRNVALQKISGKANLIPIWTKPFQGFLSKTRN